MFEKPEAEDSEAPAERHESETPEERDSRVARLRDQIAQGKYKPDTRKLAARIVDAHLRRKR